jgi:hypothetical protein
MDTAVTIKLYETLTAKFDKETAELLIAYIDAYIEEKLEIKLNKKIGLRLLESR